MYMEDLAERLAAAEKRLAGLESKSQVQKDITKDEAIRYCERLKESLDRIERDLLKNISTCALVDELEKREGVKAIITDPYEPYKITTKNEHISDIGPAIILQVID